MHRTSIDWRLRQLYDESSPPVLSANWRLRLLYDTTGLIPTFAWGTQGAHQDDAVENVAIIGNDTGETDDTQNLAAIGDTSSSDQSTVIEKNLVRLHARIDELTTAVVSLVALANQLKTNQQLYKIMPVDPD